MNHMVEPENAGVQIVTGWSLSILLHGALLVAIFTMMPRMIVAVEKEAFRWDVALVDRPQEQSAPPTVQESKAVPPSAKPQRRTVSRPVEPAPPQTVTRQVQAREVLQPVQREAQPVVETVQPIQRQEAAHEVVNSPSPELKQIEPVVREIASADVIRETTTPIEQKAVQPVTAVTEMAREDVTPVLTGQPSIESRQENTVVHREPMAAVSNSAPVVQQPESIAETPITREAVQSIQETVSPIEAAPPAPVIARSVAPSPAPKADHRWLADSLHRRVNELRHYPRTARLNGLQGKVVLRVSINQEGNLEDVSVMKSSGHESLDNAAMEAVRRACPLHLKHELEAPKVVMTLPVTYSLGQ